MSSKVAWILGAIVAVLVVFGSVFLFWRKSKKAEAPKVEAPAADPAPKA